MPITVIPIVLEIDHPADASASEVSAAVISGLRLLLAQFHPITRQPLASVINGAPAPVYVVRVLHPG